MVMMIDVHRELAENTRGWLYFIYLFIFLLKTPMADPWAVVLGQDPLIPPQLLQSEIPAVCHLNYLFRILC